MDRSSWWGLALFLEKSNSRCERPGWGTPTPRAGLQAPPSGLRRPLVQFTLEWRQTFGESLYSSPKERDIRHRCLLSVSNTSQFREELVERRVEKLGSLGPRQFSVPEHGKRVVCCSSGCCWRPAGVQELEPGMEHQAFLTKTLGICPWL